MKFFTAVMGLARVCFDKVKGINLKYVCLVFLLTIAALIGVVVLQMREISFNTLCNHYEVEVPPPGEEGSAGALLKGNCEYFSFHAAPGGNFDSFFHARHVNGIARVFATGFYEDFSKKYIGCLILARRGFSKDGLVHISFPENEKMATNLTVVFEKDIMFFVYRYVDSELDYKILQFWYEEFDSMYERVRTYPFVKQK